MAGIFPTQIEQINDFSSKAGTQVLDVLNKAPKTNYFDILSKVVDQATKATESQRLTEAVDAYNRAMEAGKSASEALVGLDPRVTGSKAFKDEADKIRSSILDQRANDRQEAMWQNTLHRQALEDESNALLADMLRFKATTPYGAPIWLDRHQAELKNNPLAYNKIMSILQGTDLSSDASVAPLSTGAFNTLALDSSNQAATTLKEADRILSNASNLGIALTADLEKSPYLKDLTSFISSKAKDRDYKGGDFSDYADNVTKAYETLSSDFKNLPMEQILATMERHHINPKTSAIPFIGRFVQDDVDISAARKELETLSKNYEVQKEAAERALTVKSMLKDVVNNEQIKTEILNANTLLSKIDSQVKSSWISESEGNKLKANIQKALFSKLAPYGFSADKINAWSEAIK